MHAMARTTNRQRLASRGLDKKPAEAGKIFDEHGWAVCPSVFETLNELIGEAGPEIPSAGVVEREIERKAASG